MATLLYKYRHFVPNVLISTLLFSSCSSVKVLITKPLSGALDVHVPVTVSLDLDPGKGDKIDPSWSICYETDSKHKYCTPLSAPVLQPLAGLKSGINYTLNAYLTTSEGDIIRSSISKSHFTTAAIDNEPNEKRAFGLVEQEGEFLHQKGVDAYLAGDLVSAEQMFRAALSLQPLNQNTWQGVAASQFGLGLYGDAAKSFLSAMMFSDDNSMFRNMRISHDWDLFGRLLFHGGHTEHSFTVTGDEDQLANKVVLVSTFFRGNGKYSIARFQEIVDAQLANLMNVDVKAVVLVADVEADCNPTDFLGYHDKLQVVQQQGRGPPTWGELFRIGQGLFPHGECVLFSHGDVAYFSQNASLGLVPSLLRLHEPRSTPLPPAAAAADFARPVSLALTRRPHSTCPWESGGGHVHELPVDLCSGPHGVAEGVLGYDAFAFVLPLPERLLSLADKLRINHLGADLKMVEMMSLCDLLVVDPCLMVVATHLHCTLERTYQQDEDLVTRPDVEAGRYSIAVRPNYSKLVSAFQQRESLRRNNDSTLDFILTYPGSGDDYLRRHFASIGSVEQDTERMHTGLALTDCVDANTLVLPTTTFPKPGRRHVVPPNDLRRTIPGKCSDLVAFAFAHPIGHAHSPVRYLLVRDPFDVISQNFLYHKTTHRSAHFLPRRMRRSREINSSLYDWVAREYFDPSDNEWRSYALKAALNWKQFHAPIASGHNRASGDSSSRISPIVVLSYKDLLSEKGLRGFEAYHGSVLSTKRLGPHSLGHVQDMVNTEAFGEGLRETLYSVMAPVMCAFDMEVPVGNCHNDYSSQEELTELEWLHRRFESTAAHATLLDECIGHGESSRCVVAFTLYGDDERYTGGVIANARALHPVYGEGFLGPLWRMRVYYDNTSPAHVIEALEHLGVELVLVVDKTGQMNNPRAWRFLVAADESVARYLMRDVDSRIGVREAAAVIEWVESGQPFHIMRDHPSHTIYAQAGFMMQAGMWGGTHSAAPEMRRLLEAFSDNDHYYTDQLFLRDKIWPLAVARGVLQHDSFDCSISSSPPSFPFPWTGRLHEFDFVGAVVHGDGLTRPGDDNALKQARQPLDCVDKLPTQQLKQKDPIEYIILNF